jgi:hypothetical protein
MEEGVVAVALRQDMVSCVWKPMWILPIVSSTPCMAIRPDMRPTLHKGDVGGRSALA